MYIAADERDTIMVRANVRKDTVELYPVKTEKARALLVDMLEEMNALVEKPEWYNTITDNCTSRIGWHVNRVSPGRIPPFPWQGSVSGFADGFALEHGLLDTDLPLDEARKKYDITARSQAAGDVPDYSKLIRTF
jgi:hypothetical protein